MQYLYAICTIPLAACTQIPNHAVFVAPFEISVEVAPHKLQSHEWGSATRTMHGATVLKCSIVLRRYPTCIAHEMRHCFEGDWHPRDVLNTEDC